MEHVDFKSRVVRQIYKKLYGVLAGGLIKRWDISLKRK
jgi:hypothetical protein